MGYYSAVEKEKILLFITTSIDLEDIYARRKKSDGERQMLYVLSYTGNLCKSLAGRYGAGNRRLSEFGIRVPLAGPPPPPRGAQGCHVPGITARNYCWE